MPVTFDALSVPLLASVASVIAEFSWLTTEPSAESPTCSRLSVVAAVWVKVSSCAIRAVNTTLSAAAPGSSDSEVTREPLESSSDSVCSVAETLSSEPPDWEHTKDRHAWFLLLM